MNKYGNALLDEYYGLQESGGNKIALFHVDYVETIPKSNGSYTSVHTDIESNDGGGNGDGNCDDWSPLGALLALGAGLCCCLNTETVCECVSNCLCSIVEGLWDSCC